MPACTARMRQGRAVARAEGPRHRRPRLRHEAHRRGDASAASRHTQSSRTNGCIGTACLRSGRRTGQCSHAQKDAARLDCPRLALGCQATFRPPVGAATRSNRRCALPHHAPPRGHTKEGTGAAALCPCRCFLSPLNPLQGALRIASAPAGKRLCRSCRCLSRLPRRTGLPPNAVSACLYPAAVFPPSLAGFALYCRRAPASRAGPPGLRCWRTAVAGPASCRGTGGVRCCRTRRGRGLAGSVVAACPHTPRRSLRSAVGRTVFYCRAVCCRAPVAGACSFP